MFPVSVSGSIRVRNLGNPAPFVKPATERIVDMLDAAYASDVWPEDAEVRFKTAFFGRGSNWNILAPFNSGTLTIEPEDTSLRVRYRLSTVRMLLFVTAAVGLISAIPAWQELSRGEGLQKAAEIFSAGWLWLFGMNYLIGMIRIPIWLKRGLRNIGK
jgi:hypothetical protein